MYEEIYETMRESKYPIYIWGNGSMAHVVYQKVIREYISVEGFFVNVSTRWQEQHEDSLPCLTLQHLLDKQLPFAVVMGHGHIELMREISRNKLVKDVYVIPNPYDYYIPEKNVIEKALDGGIAEVYPWLIDAESRDNLWAYFVAHSDKYREFYNKARTINGLFCPDVWRLREEEVYYDIGAWNGDTIREFLVANNGRYKSIEAFEPDAVVSKDLIHSIQAYPNIRCHKIGLSNISGVMRIQGSGTQSAYIENVESGNIPVCRLDDLAGKLMPPTIMKIGVPKLTLAILHGAELLIRSTKPRLIISIAWGNGNDLLDTIKWIHQVNTEYKLALRYRLLMPTQLWLYAY